MNSARRAASCAALRALFCMGGQTASHISPFPPPSHKGGDIFFKESRSLVGSQRFTALPSRSTGNLVKFQLSL